MAGNKPTHREGCGNSYKPIAGGLLIGNSKPKVNPTPPQAKCFYCSQAHWSDKCSTLETLEV